ncbi:hypothetical protein AA0Z99_03275 [Agrococcus sp. 1P02AA]|uniref:hypothetical protein n=1 Tax=Agrococcus sp. 1P02AA TaxID=3132259 RepID=UPI0039A4574D
MSFGARAAGAAMIMALGVALSGCGGPGQTGATASDAAPPAQSAPGQESPPTGGDLERDPVLAAMLEDLIVEELPPVALRSSDSVASECGTDAGACYEPEEPAIVVTSEWTDFRQPELLAHEYLHHVWERDGLDADAALATALDEAFDDEEGLGALVPPWQDSYVEADGSIMPTELFSYACTGLRSDQLATVIAERCQQYLHVDRLPVARSIDQAALLREVDALREAAGLEPMEPNPHATAASEARAALFAPTSQVPLGEFPESVTEHLDAGCAPARYGAQLTRPSDPAQMAASLDALLEGALTDPELSGIGMATTAFDHIDARAVFDERTLRVNASLVVVTVCG